MVSLRRYLRVPHELKPSVLFKQDSLSPSKIALQIAMLQVFYYLTATLLFYCWASLVGHPLEFHDWLFTAKYIDVTNGYGLSLCLLWLLDSLICVVFLTVIVGRSKLAWDFAVTVHAVNLIVVLLSTDGALPQLTWWVLQLLSSLILVFLGTWTARWRELKDTFFEGMVEVGDMSTGLGNNGTVTNTNNNSPIELKDLESQT